MADITSIPASRVPLLEPGSNVMSREWYRFLFNQFGQTGGGTTALTLSDLELAPLGEANAAGLVDEVQGLLSAPPTTTTQTRYGSFAATATQTLGATNTATAVTFDATPAAAGVGLSTSSRVLPGATGAFYVSVIVHRDKTAGGDSLMWLWLRKNGTDLANTAVTARVKGSDGEGTLTTGQTVVVGPADYIEAMWASDSTNVILSATAATGFSPAGPSAVLTITQVDL
jgi:hypothetical protein